MNDKRNWPFKVSSIHEKFKENIDWPKISIVTPSYNQGDYIEETILSVINQQYPNLEYIIIDGGSDDQTVKIIEKYASFLTYWISEKDEGQTDAINKGFKRASGTICAYLNSDDCYYEGALHKIASAYLQQEELSDNFLFIGDCYWAQDFTDPEGWLDIPKFPKDLKGALIKRGLAPQPAMFWTVRCKSFPFYNQLQFCMDFEFWLQLILRNYKPIRVDFCIALFRQHELSKTSTLNHVLSQELNGLTLIYSKNLKQIDDQLQVRNLNLKHEQIAYSKLLIASFSQRTLLLDINKIGKSNLPFYLKVKLLITKILKVKIFI